MLEHGLTIVPTLSSWESGMDVMRYKCSEWHKDYTLPALWRFFQPSLMSHWSFYYDWTTAYEIEFKSAYPKWMAFISEYKNMGGCVTAGSDSGFEMKLFGFDFICELELLQEAGFHQLEVVRAATLEGAKLLGLAEDIGSMEPGKKADLLVIDKNPLLNFKVLYGTGHMRMNTATGQVERIMALRYTIKDGIIYDPQQPLADVAGMVALEKESELSAG
jgi:predicted amidohydrolase YtcJ